MKLLVILTLLFADVLLASPIASQQRENVAQDPTLRWELLPDAEGRLHLIDLNSYEVPVEPFFVAETDVRFLLFTRRNPTTAQIITLNLASIQSSNFDSRHPTRFTIHGWNGDISSRVNTLVAEAYLQRGEYNMITVDWALGGTTLNYITARNRCPEVGRFIARFADFLHSHGLIRYPEVHVVGHSLGGQVAGFVGKETTRGKLQVIMALDPAGPLFPFDDPTQRTAPSDAVYVEIIHTNAGALGMREPIGHASFYPNGGRLQPGCTEINQQCSHTRCILFYAESISTRFTSTECTSFEDILNDRCTPTGRTASLGGPIGNIGLTGNYFLTTNDDTPFSRG